MDNEQDKDTTVQRGKSVTIVISRMVFPGHEKEYEDWVKQLADAAKESPGNTGVTILIPSKGQTGLRHVVMYFTDEKSMQQWETSYVRQKLSHEADVFSRKTRQEQTGLETWFSIPECPELEAPPPWKMAIVTFLAVYVLSIIIVQILGLLKLNFYVESVLVAGLLVGILTWAVMPVLSRYVFRKWLYK
jgi:antibiotic biosynthesis monooxygenase (ABM) superfamily enzyme